MPVMFVIISFILMATFPSALAAEGPINYSGYELVWHDEFENIGPPDPTRWTYEKGYIRNKELQWYQPDNARCEGGCLVIEALRQSKPNPDYDPASDYWGHQREQIEYTSASVTTQGLHAWRYGRFEVRAKLQVDNGLWPAIWLLGKSRNEGRGWPACGEIDMMEYYRGKIYANAAWGGQDGRSKWDAVSIPIEGLTGESPQAWVSEFHVWRMDWDQHEVKLYVEGRLLNTIDLSATVNETPGGENPFHEPHYMLLNLAVGGTPGGDPSSTEFPRQTLIDYVRIYQKLAEE